MSRIAWSSMPRICGAGSRRRQFRCPRRHTQNGARYARRAQAYPIREGERGEYGSCEWFLPLAGGGAITMTSPALPGIT